MSDQQSFHASSASVEISKRKDTLRCFGQWTLSSISTLEAQLKAVIRQSAKVMKIDAGDIDEMDSAGALLLHNLINRIKALGQSVSVVGLSDKHQSSLGLVAQEIRKVKSISKKEPKHNILYLVGLWAVDKWVQLTSFLAFIGEVVVTLYRSILQPRRIQWKSTLVAIDYTGYRALPIIALMSFLIGIVLAYQLGEQLKVYGANIFIVDVTGVAILREFAPLITAIIVAGRTSTAFAALIGTMKVNEELDALNAMGFSPIERLVLPRIFALIFALPLLVVWSDIFGILGSMVMAQNMLDISFNAFLERLQTGVALKHYVLGLIKTPVFALIIATVGCFQGFQVELSAQSVGRKTTQSAVQSIFLIIIADAAFSIIFNWMGL